MWYGTLFYFSICKQWHLWTNRLDWPNQILSLLGVVALDQVLIGHCSSSSNQVRTCTLDRSSWLFKRAHFHRPAARPRTRQCQFCYFLRLCMYVSIISCQMIELSMRRWQLLERAFTSPPLLARYVPISDTSR